jgi:peptidyl-prolyl cis-trans isomerase C
LVFAGAELKQSTVWLAIAAFLSAGIIALAADPDDAPIYTPPTPAAAPVTQPAVDPNLVIATVGDEKITAGDFNNLIADLPPEMQTQLLARPDGKRRLVDELINMKLLSDEATRRKLDEEPKIRVQLQQVLAQALMQSLGDDPAGDEKFFNDNKSYFEQVNARHILIATGDSVVPSAHKLTDAQALAKAQQIKARLVKGEDFATIAKEESDDTSSGAQGGDLGVVTRGKMVPFEAAVFALKKDQISDPVRTQFGYHIIQATTDKTAPSFADAKPRVEQRRFEVFMEQLKKQTPPHYDEAFFGDSSPTTQPIP